MRFVFCVWLCVLMIVGAAPPFAVAQSLFSTTTSDTTSEAAPQDDALAETLRKAREAGLSVIVVDAQGNLITQPASSTADTAAPDGAPLSPEGSALMQAQKRGAKFRETLSERLDALPDSLNEVRFILRATSPDGRIMAYVEVLLISALLPGDTVSAWTKAGMMLGLYALGTLLLFISSQTMRHLIGPYVLKGYVTGRIKETPQGYREKMPFLVFRFFVGVGGSLYAIAVAYLLGLLFFDPVTDTSLQVTILAINAAFLACRTVGDVWRMVLSPFLTQYRIPRFSDRDAIRLYQRLCDCLWHSQPDDGVDQHSAAGGEPPGDLERHPPRPQQDRSRLDTAPGVGVVAAGDDRLHHLWLVRAGL